MTSNAILKPVTAHLDFSFGFKVEKYIDEENVSDRIVWGAIGSLMSLDITGTNMISLLYSAAALL